MTNQTRRKGNTNEEKVCWFFTHLGYTAWSPSWGGRGHGTFRSTDILGVFDVLATSSENMVLAQVKTEDSFRKAVEQQIVDCSLPTGVHREYWLFRSNNEVLVRRYLSGVVEKYKVDLERARYDKTC